MFLDEMIVIFFSFEPHNNTAYALLLLLLNIIIIIDNHHCYSIVISWIHKFSCFSVALSHTIDVTLALSGTFYILMGTFFLSFNVLYYWFINIELKIELTPLALYSTVILLRIKCIQHTFFSVRHHSLARRDIRQYIILVGHLKK